MKKLLLALPIAVILGGCGGSNVEDIAHDYCTAIKKHDFKNAQDLATPDALRNRETMYDNNPHKYSNVFLSQNCDVSKVVSGNDSETYYSVYFGGSKLDSVEIEWDDKKEQYFVISDAFKNDLKLY